MPAEGLNLSPPQNLRTDSKTTQLPIQWVMGSALLGSKAAGK